jgi:CRISPR-associated endonuclease Cas2
MPRAARLMVFCYDISADRVRNRVAKRLETVAVRVQDSVFEARMTAERAHRLGDELAGLLAAGDSLRVYAIGAGDLRDSRAWGAPPLPTEADCWIV